MLLTFLGSSMGKYIMIGVAFLAMIAYFQFNLWNAERIIQNHEITIKELKVDLTIVKGNLDESIKVNLSNLSTIETYKADIKILEENNQVILDGKTKEVLSLKGIIKDLQTKHVYPKELKYETCVIKIKEDANESIVYNTISDIGI